MEILMKTLVSRSTIIAVSFALILAVLVSAPRTQAQTAASPFTGQCGGVFNINSIYSALWEYTNNSVDYDEGVSVLMSMNFDASKVDFSIQSFSVDQGKFGLNEPPAAGQKKVQGIRIISSIPFVMTPQEGVNGAYLVTLDPDEADPSSFLMMPVNGGSTFLIQGKTFGAAGVCQKI
jgi:hypothetical protein